MSYFKKPELNDRALSILNQVVAKFAEGGIKAGIREGHWGHVLSVTIGDEEATVMTVEEGRSGTTWRKRDTGKLVYKFPTLRHPHTGNIVASQLGEDSKNLVDKIHTKIVDRIEAICKENEISSKREEADKRRQEGLEGLHAAYPKFARNVYSDRGIIIKFDYLSVEKAHEILTALEDKGIVL